METTKQTSSDMNDRRAGFALAATIAMLALLSFLVVNVFANAMVSVRSQQMDVGKTRTFYAAEAGAESAMAQLALALKDAVLEDAELSSISPPDIEVFNFHSFTVAKIGGVEPETITDGPFTGL
mgnify:CR=1 FL=1|jgi:type II secretory pathway component PulK